MIKDIAFTAYRVTDMAASRAFYEGQLGLKMETHWEDKWVEYGIGAGTFALQTVMGEPSSDGAVIAFEVENFAETFDGLKAANVPVAVEPYESPVCWMAIVKDPDGNPVCIHQRKVHAAAAPVTP